MLNRRTFLQLSSAIAAGTILTRCGERTTMNKTTPSIDRIGLQLFSIPKLLEQDFAGTLKMIAQIGYKEVEFYGPYSFSAPEDVERWKSVSPSLGFSGSGFFGHTVQEVKKILDDNGLSSPSMHTNLATLKQHMSEMAEAAQALGTTYVILPSAETQTNLDGYRRQADEFNEIGASAAKYGLRFAYHNHGNGLKEMEGKIPMELILERTDPKLVNFQMDIYWTTAGGIDPVAYLDKYRGRYRLMHIKDMAKPVRFSGDGGDPKQWIELFPYMADAGSGVLDLKTILSHAQKSGVEHFLVERDLAPNPKGGTGERVSIPG
ncbi:MAG: sugar phosphate isomerase/epimerase [Bacteroidota bacterium]|nr:sugar phosphate isomerase/epimerase [Bacteroidota bacterium]